MLFRYGFFMSLEISFWKGCALSVKLMEGTCGWTIDSVINSSQKEECVKETAYEAKQQTSPPYCHVNSKRPLYLSAFTPLGSVKWSKLDDFKVFDLWSPIFFFLWRCRPLLVARDLLFSVNLCGHLRCNSLILQDSEITLWKILAFGGQCHLILRSVWAAKIMHRSCSGRGGHYRCGWYFCGCRELWWYRQTHQKLLCCSSSVRWTVRHHMGNAGPEQACKRNFLHLPLGRRSTVWSSSSLIVSDSRLNQSYSRMILFCFGHWRDLHESYSLLGSLAVISLSCIPTEESSTNSNTTAEIQKNVDLLLHLTSLVHPFAFLLYLQCKFICKTTHHYQTLAAFRTNTWSKVIFSIFLKASFVLLKCYWLEFPLYFLWWNLEIYKKVFSVGCVCIIWAHQLESHVYVNDGRFGLIIVQIGYGICYVNPLFSVLPLWFQSKFC